MHLAIEDEAVVDRPHAGKFEERGDRVAGGSPRERHPVGPGIDVRGKAGGHAAEGGSPPGGDDVERHRVAEGRVDALLQPTVEQPEGTGEVVAGAGGDDAHHRRSGGHGSGREVHDAVAAEDEEPFESALDRLPGRRCSLCR